MNVIGDIDEISNKQQLFIESDIVQQSTLSMNQAHTQLLSRIPLTGKHGSKVTWGFNPRNYVSIRNQHISSIEIRLSDQNGKPLKFETGNVVVTLHFQPISRFGRSI